MNYRFSSHSYRAVKARMAARLGRIGIIITMIVTISLGLGGGIIVGGGNHLGRSIIGLAVWGVIALAWMVWDLEQLPAVLVAAGSTNLDQILPARLAASYRDGLSQPQLWEQLSTGWQTQFILARFELSPETLLASLPSEPVGDSIWETAVALSNEAGLTTVSEGAIACALIVGANSIMATLASLKLTRDDIVAGLAWLGRTERLGQRERKFFGGLGRDWASGFTPTLERYAANFSAQIEQGGYRYETLAASPITDQLIATLDSRPGGVVVTGPTGVGKTALIYALAQRLLENQAAGTLAYRQVLSLNASLILSTSQTSGNIEDLILTLLVEAVQAGNIILTLDEAQLFFGHGPGAINLSQILLPILENRRLELILTMTPEEWQKLSSANPALAGRIIRLNMTEPDEAATIRLIQDHASLLESQHRLVATYEGVRAAYRLSGRYNQDEAYPGRALKLLEAAFARPQGRLVNAASVEAAIESTYGVKAGTASAAESQVLLHLEDQIHQRMINQSRAVTVVANALRRARAGVANPKRPIGSFLFLGPTGVGKTELAKSLAAVYFNDEANMVRVDMTEYQRPDDVQRILADTGATGTSLLATVRQRPFSVVLLDEIEKAHPDILNLLLQLLDEGKLTDVVGRSVSFKDTIIIATSNAGADTIRSRIAAGESLDDFEAEFTDDLISSGSFKPELLNRFDEIVLFRPLNPDELARVVTLMIAEVNRNLDAQKLKVVLTPAAIAAVVATGNDPRLGARPMRRAVQRLVEDTVAGRVLRGEAGPGDTITLDAPDLAVVDKP